MNDLIRREDAIKVFIDWGMKEFGFHDLNRNERFIDALSALPSAETHEILTETHGVCSDLISREAVKAEVTSFFGHSVVFENRIDALPSAEAVQGWRTDKPIENGKYMVTLDAWGHRYIDIMYYGKPQMPNCEVRGMCWYKADHEYGDVVYEDEDILAWMPLPEPYREEAEE